MLHVNALRCIRPALLLPLMTLACGAPEARRMAVRFNPQVRGESLRCDTTYADIGRSASTLQLLDFKLYVNSLVLVRAGGERHPFVLEQDDRWQRDSLALLDFEDGTGTCDTGSPEVHTEVVGQAPAYDDYERLEFELGVPEELNHLDGATALAPLNAPGMWWSWKGGYKFMRLDVRSRGNATFFFHLGASGCTGSVPEGFSCTGSGRARISLDRYHPERNQVVLELADFYAQSDLDQAIDRQTDFISGCMSSASDPECPALMAALGLSAEGSPHSTPATLFTVR